MLLKLFSYYVRGSSQLIKQGLGLPFKRPYLKYKEVAIFEEILDVLKPQQILEYGCGQSTVFFADKLDQGAVWHAIEHNKSWYKNIVEKTEPQAQIKMHFVPEDEERSTEAERFESYIEYPSKLGDFDLIFIDGVARNACMKKSHDLLSEKGLVLVHDCNRPAYHDMIKTYKHWLILEDYRKTAGGFAFGSNSMPIAHYFNLNNHESLWRFDTAFQNFFKMKFLIGKQAKGFRLSGSAMGQV